MNLPRPPRFEFTLVNFLNLVGVVAIIYLVVILGQTIKRNYDLNTQITDLKAQIALLQDQKDQLSYNIQYYQTESFQEREARAKLGLQMPGEQVVVLPRPSTAPAPSDDATKPTKKKSNFQQWLDFLGGKS
jgi:cell division protein FtsB